jgi:hypothetical protein
MAQSSRSRARVVFARDRLAQLDRAMVTGLELIAMEILEVTDEPDATPYGEGLVEAGSFISYADGKRVGGDADKKPKGLRVGKGALVAVGYPFPGRFQELGTVRQPARPFLTPAVYQVVDNDAAVTAALARGFSSFIGKAVRSAIRGGVGRT